MWRGKVVVRWEEKEEEKEEGDEEDEMGDLRTILF
jgi:hypothetical protein